jgi:hypothetical protein
MIAVAAIVGVVMYLIRKADKNLQAQYGKKAS